jgi:PAS domain S-box-containing protein
VGIYRTTADGRILAGNPAFARMLGYSSWEELASRNLNAPDCEPQYSRGQFTERLEKEGRITGLESEWRRRDGSVIFVRENARAIRDEAGQILYYEGTAEDITERKRAEEGLRESEQFNREVIANAQEGVAVYDREFRYQLWNRSMEELTGVPAAEALGKCAFDLFPHLREQKVDLLLRRALAGEVVRAPDTPFRVPTTGKSGWVSGVYGPHFGASGQIHGVIGTIRDITERKRTEEELQRSFDRLRALAARLQRAREEERTSVAREIHDELGQALTAIKIDLSSVIRELPQDKKGRSESILKLVDQTIQSVRRISSELRPAILDALGLVAAVEWAAEDFEVRTGIKCRLDLPQEDIVIDQERATTLFRIFQETLTNVVRHANATEVNAQLAKEEGSLTLKIHDNGKGIDAEQLSSSRSLGILGMRERALLLGGELDISGAPGKGTTVRVRIPQGHPTQWEDGK